MKQITIESPFIYRFIAYLNERFPIALLLGFFLSFWGIDLAFHKLYNYDVAYTFGWLQVSNFFSYYTLFFLVRIFDEHKDYDVDCINHPQRVLQRGLITLKQLQLIAVVCILFQLLVAINNGGNVLVFWALAFVFLLLMTKEFFVPIFLRERLFLYMVSHSFLTPLTVLWIRSMHTTTFDITVLDVWIALLFWFGGMAFEVGRKIRIPAEESPTEDMYSKLIGTGGASLLTTIFSLLSTACLYLLMTALNVEPYLVSVLVISLIPMIILCTTLFRSPSKKAVKLFELSTLASYLTVEIVLIIFFSLK